MDEKRVSMTIGEVAAQAGVNAQTLRYYERRGIIAKPRRGASGYRLYQADTVQLIRFIKRAQDLGFTLDEIEDLIALRKNTGRSRGEVRAIATAKIEDIDKRIRQLQSMRQALGQLVKTCACSETPECPILEALENDQLRPRLNVTP